MNPVPHYTIEDRQKFEEHIKEDKEVHAQFIAGITEVNEILKKQNKTYDEFSLLVLKHIDRVEPVLKAHEDAIIVKARTDEIGESVVKWSKRVGAVAVIGSAIMYIINHFHFK